MKEETNIDPSAVSAEPDTDLVSLLRSMQQQLLHLEKKVDMLLSRSQERPSEDRRPHARPFGKRPMTRPFRSQDHAQHFDKRDRERSPRDRDSVPGHFYERRPQEKSRRSTPGKKPFAFKRKDRD